MTKRFVLSILFAAFALSFAGIAAAEKPTTRTSLPHSPRILFIGNSYTAYNGGLPKLLTAMAKSAGKTIECDWSVAGGKSLEWHWTEGKAQAAIAKGGWDYVVLQDYSTQAILKPDKLAEYARKFDEQIKKIGATTVFYMTWARQNQPEKQETITKAYTDIAHELGAKIAPAGLAWQRAFAEKKDLVLHYDDKSHPTPVGTYLNACVFYQVLLNAPPPKAVPSIYNERTQMPQQISDDLAAFLRKVAAETVADMNAAATAQSAR